MYPLNHQVVKPNEAQPAECQHNNSIECSEEIESSECPDDVNDEITPELKKSFNYDLKRGMIYVLIYCLLIG